MGMGMCSRMTLKLRVFDCLALLGAKPDYGISSFKETDALLVPASSDSLCSAGCRQAVIHFADFYST